MMATTTTTVTIPATPKPPPPLIVQQQQKQQIQNGGGGGNNTRRVVTTGGNNNCVKCHRNCYCGGTRSTVAMTPTLLNANGRTSDLLRGISTNGGINKGFCDNVIISKGGSSANVDDVFSKRNSAIVLSDSFYLLESPRSWRDRQKMIAAPMTSSQQGVAEKVSIVRGSAKHCNCNEFLCKYGCGDVNLSTISNDQQQQQSRCKARYGRQLLLLNQPTTTTPLVAATNCSSSSTSGNGFMTTSKSSSNIGGSTDSNNGLHRSWRNLLDFREGVSSWWRFSVQKTLASSEQMTTMPEEWQRKENKKRLRGKLTEAVKSVKYKRPSSLGMSEVMRRARSRSTG